MFIDASAIVAILNDEPGAAALAAKIEAEKGRIVTSPIARFEAVVSLAAARSRRGALKLTAEAIALAKQGVDAFLDEADAEQTPIVAETSDGAIDAAARYGRVVGHPASLNLGDCFAYAAAKLSAEAVLFVGEDFSRTDIKQA